MKNTRLVLLLIDYLIDNFENSSNPSPEKEHISTNQSYVSQSPSSGSSWESLGIDATQFGQEDFSSAHAHDDDRNLFQPSSAKTIHSTQVKRPSPPTSDVNTSQTSVNTNNADKISGQPSEFDDFSFDF